MTTGDNKLFFKHRPGAATAQKGVDDFIAGAGKPASAFPWADLDDEDHYKLYNLRLTDAEKSKLEFIVKNTNVKSMQEYCIALLRPAIDADIYNLTGTSDGVK